MVNTNPKIWVGCLAAYNSGSLHGNWIDATQDVEVIEKEIQKILKDSPVPNAEEWEIFEYDDFGCNFELLDQYGLPKLVEAARFVAELGIVASKLLNYFGGNVKEAKEAYEEEFYGFFPSLVDFAEEFYYEAHKEELEALPSILRFSICWENVAEELILRGDIFTINIGFDEVYVFWR